MEWTLRHSSKIVFYYSIYYFSKQRHERLWGYMWGSSNTEKAGKARSYGLYRHLRRNKEIIKNLFRYYLKYSYTGFHAHYQKILDDITKDDGGTGHRINFHGYHIHMEFKEINEISCW